MTFYLYEEHEVVEFELLEDAIGAVIEQDPGPDYEGVSGWKRPWIEDADGNQVWPIEAGNPETFDLPITLSEATRHYNLAYSTLAQAAREGRIEARRSGPKTWLTTRGAIEQAIEQGKLRPRK